MKQRRTGLVPAGSCALRLSGGNFGASSVAHIDGAAVVITVDPSTSLCWDNHHVHAPTCAPWAEGQGRVARASSGRPRKVGLSRAV